MNVLDLFSGIGGFSLGLERAGGFKTVAFCEINPFCQRVLAKHWPRVPRYDDVKTLTADQLRADGIDVIDVITGGFPCQDLSLAGLQAGLGGARSGLWSEIVRLVGELRPKFIIIENVANLLAGPCEQPGGWFSRVLCDLAALGYDAEWENIPAATVGAPHRRERVWIVAYPTQERSVAGMEGILQSQAAREFRGSFGGSWVFGLDNPEVCGMDDGIRPGLDGHFALGNTVVPQIPEIIGRAILATEALRGDALNLPEQRAARPRSPEEEGAASRR